MLVSIKWVNIFLLSYTFHMLFSSLFPPFFVMLELTKLRAYQVLAKSFTRRLHLLSKDRHLSVKVARTSCDEISTRSYLFTNISIIIHTYTHTCVYVYMLTFMYSMYMFKQDLWQRHWENFFVFVQAFLISWKIINLPQIIRKFLWSSKQCNHNSNNFLNIEQQMIYLHKYIVVY